MNEEKRILEEIKMSINSNEVILLPEYGKSMKVLKNGLIGLIGLLLFSGLVVLIAKGAGA